MFCPQQLSKMAKQYLGDFCKILDDMIAGMTGAELTDSISHNFIVQMIPHHEAAIQMSKNLLQDTALAPLQTIARNIITEQTKSIQDMRRVLKTCAALSNTREDLCLYQQRFGQITKTMFCKMRCAPGGNNLNRNFMLEMIPHHQGAIAMSENALSYPICPELDPILRKIIVSQEQGVREMECLLRQITRTR